MLRRSFPYPKPIGRPNLCNSIVQHEQLIISNTIHHQASITAMDTKSRSFDFVERYHVAQHRAGSLPYITIIGLMINPDIHQLYHQIALNINQSMQKHPVLVAAIDDIDSRRSKWIPNNHDPPFVHNQFILHPILETEIYTVRSVTEVAEAEDTEAQGFNLAQGPLWRVKIYRRELGYPTTFFVAMTIHQVVTDSMGALNLFEEILWQPSDLPTTTSETTSKETLPPKAEKTMRIQPSVARTIQKGVQWIFNHKPSWKVPDWIGGKTKWPPLSRLRALPRNSNIGHACLDLGRDQDRVVDRVVERLEALGSQIGSVHAVLHTAAVIALAAAAYGDVYDTISTETPKSLRSEKRKHPRIGGNYTGLIERSIPVSSLGSHTMASFTNKFHNYIHSSEAESKARSNAGEFRLFPDRIVPDLWRTHLSKLATSDDPYRHSLSISNLGRFEVGQAFGLSRVWFCRASMP